MNSVERVKEICKERGIPISKLEKACDFGNGYIGQLKKGSFPADRLATIANKLNLSTDFFLETNPSPYSEAECWHMCDSIISMCGRDMKQLIGFVPGDIIIEIRNREYRFPGTTAAQIAEHLNISVDALLGKKNKPTDDGELSPDVLEIIKLYEAASPEIRAAVMAALRTSAGK